MKLHESEEHIISRPFVFFGPYKVLFKETGRERLSPKAVKSAYFVLAYRMQKDGMDVVKDEKAAAIAFHFLAYLTGVGPLERHVILSSHVSELLSKARSAYETGSEPIW